MVTLIGAHAKATTYSVNSQSSFDAALSAAAANDIIEWEDGTYADIYMEIDKASITIQAETSGGVIFNGASRVKITADYVTMEGMQWVGGDILSEVSTSDRNVIRTNGSYNEFRQLNISDYNCYKYFLMDGESQYNVVAYCNFESRANYEDQNILSIRVDDVLPNYHVIQYCSFKNFSGAPGGTGGNDDGVEPIRIGVSSEAANISRSTVEYCYFTQCNGDGEIISSKATQNLYRYNTFADNPYAELVLRHGSQSVVYGNFFIDNYGGVRVREGQDHVIFNNYFQGITNRSLYLQNEASDPLSDITVLYNTFVDCEEIRLGGTGDNVPANVAFANNVFFDPKDDLFTDASGSETWLGNLYNGSLGISEPASGLSSDDLEYEFNSSGYYQPGASSPVIDAAVSGYPALPQYDGLDTDHEVGKDKLGQSRPTEEADKDLGSAEYNASLLVAPLATADNTGPDYLHSDDAEEDDLYISEVLFAPGGDDEPQEFVELRGAASATIPANTYLVFVEGDDGGSIGKVKMYFDVSGLSFGSNGYLAFVMDNSGYSFAAGANVREADISAGGIAGWQGEPLYTGSGTSGPIRIEDLSQNILLVTTSSALSGTGTDIDSDDDGEIDVSGWTIHDGVSVLDNDDAVEYGYAPLIFSRMEAEDVVRPSTSQVIEIDFTGGYVGRIGVSTGSTGDDWICASTSDSGTGAFTLNSTNTDQSFSNTLLTEVGDASLVAGEVTHDGVNAYTLSITDNFTIAASLTTTDDLECHDLTVEEAQTLTIESTATLKVNGSLTNHGTIVVASGASLVTYASKTVDAVTLQRTTSYSDGRYSLVGTPVVYDAENTGSDLGSTVYYHDETENYDSDAGLLQWKAANDEALQVGKGYAQAFQGAISFTGVPNSGTIDAPISHTESAAADASNRGFNLLSNPFSAAIDAAAFLTDNADIDGTIYLWDDPNSTEARGDAGDYLVWNDLGDVSGSTSGKSFAGQLGSMQGFFVKMTDAGSAYVTFSESQRLAGSNSDAGFFRKSTTTYPTIKLSLKSANSENDTRYAETIVGFREDATEGVDRLYDAATFGSQFDFKIYSFIHGEKYAIQGMPYSLDTEVELGLDLSEGGDFVLQVKELTNANSGVAFLLTDHLTGEAYALSQGSEVPVEAVAGWSQYRFSLAIVSSTPLYSEPLAFGADKLQFRYVGGYLVASLQDAQLPISGYSIYNLNGQLMAQEEEVNELEMQVALPAGRIYIVYIATADKVYVRRIKL